MVAGAELLLSGALTPSDVEVHSVSLASRIKQVGGLFQLLACTRTTANQPWHSPSKEGASWIIHA